MKFLIVLLFPVLGFAQTMTAGIWKSEASFKINGLPMPSMNDEKCISGSETQNPKASIERALKRNKCKLTKWVLIKNKVDAAVSCDSPDYKAKGTIAGIFESKKYDLKGSISGHHKIFQNATADVELKGEWLKKCG